MKSGRLITRRRARGRGAGTAKWLGAAAMAFLAFTFVASCLVAQFSLHFRRPVTPARIVTLSVNRGTFFVRVHDGASVNSYDVFVSRVSMVRHRPVRWPQLGFTRRMENRWGIIFYTYPIPLWLPFVLIALPTGWIWYSDRRVKAWQCAKCRYDLRGLEGGGEGGGDKIVCPECGTAKGEG